MADPSAADGRERSGNGALPTPILAACRFLDWAIAVAYRLARWGTWFGGSLVLLAAFIVAVDVLARKFFVVTLGGANELAGYSMAIGSACAFSFALLDRVHVRIDSLYQVLPVRLCAFLDLAGLVAFSVFLALVSWYGFGVFSESLRLQTVSMSPLGTPLAIPQGMWVAGLILFMVVSALLMARASLALALGDLASSRRLIGSRSTKEEIDEEVQSLGGDQDKAGDR